MSTSLGSLTVVAVNIAFGLARDYGGTSRIFAAFLKPRLWLYVLGIQFFSLIFSYTSGHSAYTARDAWISVGVLTAIRNGSTTRQSVTEMGSA